MTRYRPSPRAWLAALVSGHLMVSIVHGMAHDQAHVALSPPATLFVFIVILAGPLAGLALALFDARLGNSLIAAAMAGAFVFGVVNHFVLSSPDHVSHVAAAWRPLFASTAVLLALSEAAGAVLAFALARDRRVLS